MYTYREACSFLKEARDRSANQDFDRDTALKGLGYSVGGVAAGSLAAIPVAYSHHQQAVKNPYRAGEALSPEMGEITQSMRKLYPSIKDTAIESTESMAAPKFVQRIANSYFPSIDTTFVASKNPSVLAHELGHASGRGSLLQRIGLNKRVRTGGTLGSFAMLGNEDTRDYAAPAYAASRLPLLMEEGRASVRALKGLHAVKGRQGVMQGLKTLLPAFATYAAPAAAGTAGIAYAAHKAKSRKEKNAK